jgi:hypothetical protein
VGLFSHQNELNMNQKTPCLQILSCKLHVRMSMSPRKSPIIVFITPSILNKNGGDRLRKMSISSIFEEEILENCRFWEVQTSGFGLCIIYPNYLSCFKAVPEPGQRNWTISCHRIRPISAFNKMHSLFNFVCLFQQVQNLATLRILFIYVISLSVQWVTRSDYI